MDICILSGRLCAAPELKTTNSGLSVCTVSLAVDRGYGEQKVTDFIPLVFWKAQADAVTKYCQKGDQIMVSGTLQTRTYEQNGAKKKAFEVVVNTFDFGAKKRGEITDSAPPTDEEDLPFFRGQNFF